MIHRPTAALSAVLLALNTALCWPLFRIEYLDQFPSIEGIFIAIAKFLLDHAPHTAWFPWFNAGLPFENTYLPLVAWLTAGGAFLARTSPAHAFHFMAALAYATAPVFLFLFARNLSGRLAPSFFAALLWSLLSPSTIFPAAAADLDTPWGMRRLMNIVVYGETPHNVALCQLPLALLLIARYWSRPSPRRFALAVAIVAAVMLANAFGIVAISISALILLAAREKIHRREIISTFAILIAAYLLICRFLPPSLLSLIRVNSQLAGGDYRFTAKTNLIGISFALALCVVWILTRRLSDQTLRFALLFTLCFGGIVFLGYRNINFIPQPQRYQLEMEAGLCLSIAFALARLKIPRNPAIICTAVALTFVFWQDLRFSRRIIHPADISQSVLYRQAHWIRSNLPVDRIMVSGVATTWFGVFTNNPQLSGGFDPFAPNWIERVAVYTIYSGENAGARDAEFSIFWLKAFGCAAITVPGPASEQPLNTLRHPRKFDGVLPLLWREGDDSVYRVPLATNSLANVIPASAIVTRQPKNGLDIDPVRAYVAALDHPATLVWQNPDRGKITASLAPDQVISLQMTHDPGWRATNNGKTVPIRSDQLGMMILTPACSGNCVVDLHFTLQGERLVCFLVSLLTALALLTMLMIKPRAAAAIADTRSLPPDDRHTPA